MKAVYVCSPFRGEPPYSINKRNRNLNKAAAFCRTVAQEGNVPIAPHLYFSRYLNDQQQTERDLGAAMGIELLKRCDEVHVFGKSVSEGMANEIRLAEEIGKLVIYR